MLRLNIGTEICGLLEKKKDELEELEETIPFGKYTQKSDGIFISKDGALVKIANIKIVSVKLYFDELDIFDVKIDWTYYNLKSKREKSLKMASKEDIRMHMERDIAFKSSNSIMPFIESVLHSEWVKIEIENGVFVEGFFYHDGKVIDNTENRVLEYTAEDVKEAIEMVNAIILNRGTARINDATVMRFMLWSPFSYCLKQIGFYDANYGLILYGKSQTSKTGSVANYSWFYSEPDSTDKAISTMPVYAKRIAESTLPSLIDEASTFLSNKDNLDPIKRNILSKTLRGVMSKNNDRIDEPHALSLPIFTYNERITLEEHFKRRFMICQYDATMYVSDDDKFEFIEEYNPKSPNSPLRKLRVLGCEFAKRIAPLIESQDNRLMRIESCTMDILKNIERDVNDELNLKRRIEFDPVFYETQESNIDSVKNLEYEITTKMNRLFRENRPKQEYSKKDFVKCANNGEISFLHNYNPKFVDGNTSDKFFIHKKYFVNTISQEVGEFLTLEDIVDVLGLSKPIVKPYTVDGKTQRGFIIDGVDLESKIFGIRVKERKEGEYDDDDFKY